MKCAPVVGLLIVIVIASLGLVSAINERVDSENPRSCGPYTKIIPCMRCCEEKGYVGMQAKIPGQDPSGLVPAECMCGGKRTPDDGLPVVYY